MIYCYIHRSVFHSTTLENFLQQIGINHRDLQLDNVQRVRGFGALSPKCDVFIKPSPQGSESYAKRRQRDCRSQRGCQGNSVFWIQQVWDTHKLQDHGSTHRTSTGSSQMGLLGYTNHISEALANTKQPFFFLVFCLFILISLFVCHSCYFVLVLF